MHFIIITLLAVTGISFGLQTPAPLNASIQFISREELEQLNLNNPDLVLTPLNVAQTTQQITYSLGSRVSGDRLVAQTSNSQNWGTLQDVRLTLQYPTSGQGAVISYVSVVVQQSSNYGRGYVVSGGIGQRGIVVYVEAYSTTYLSHVSQIYGI